MMATHENLEDRSREWWFYVGCFYTRLSMTVPEWSSWTEDERFAAAALAASKLENENADG